MPGLRKQGKPGMSHVEVYYAGRQASLDKDWDKAIECFSQLGSFRDSARWLAKATAERERLWGTVNKAQADLGAEHRSFMSKIEAFFDSGNVSFSELAESLPRCRNSLNSVKALADEAGISLGAEELQLAEMESALMHLYQLKSAVSGWIPAFMFPRGDGKYGRPDESFLEEAKGLSDDWAYSYAENLRVALQNKDYDTVCSVNPRTLALACWRLAMAKPFSQERYKTAQDMLRYYESVLHFESYDDELSQLYSHYSLAGEDVIVDSMKGYLSTKEAMCEAMASLFMWVGANKAEMTTLEHMLTSGFEMTNKMQDRLHLLKNSKGKMASAHQVESSSERIYFDAASTSWDEDALRSFFGNLAFQDSQLTYSLAMRDEEKRISLASPSMTPAIQDIAVKVRESMLEEFGDEVDVSLVECVSIAGTARDSLVGILVQTSACAYLGIVFLLIPLGKKLTIKQFTLYMPTENTVSNQAEDAASLLSRASIVAGIWEDGIKQVALDAIQQMMNEGTPLTPLGVGAKNPAEEHLGGVVF